MFWLSVHQWSGNDEVSTPRAQRRGSKQGEMFERNRRAENEDGRYPSRRFTMPFDAPQTLVGSTACAIATAFGATLILFPRRRWANPETSSTVGTGGGRSISTPCLTHECVRVSRIWTWPSQTSTSLDQYVPSRKPGTQAKR